MRGEAKKRSDWNYSLLEEVISPAYARTIQLVAQLITKSDRLDLENYFSLWPIVQDQNKNTVWGFFTKKFYNQVASYDVFIMEESKKLANLQPPTAILSQQQRKTFPNLEEVLLKGKVPLVIPAQSVLDSLEKCQIPLSIVQPRLLRTLVSKNNSLFDGFPPQVCVSLLFRYCQLMTFLYKDNRPSFSILHIRH